MSNHNNIQPGKLRGQGGVTSGGGLGQHSLLVTGSEPAPCTGRCPSCGRTVEAGDLMLRLGNQFVHQGCRGHLRLAAATPSPGDATTVSSPR